MFFNIISQNTLDILIEYSDTHRRKLTKTEGGGGPLENKEVLYQF